MKYWVTGILLGGAVNPLYDLYIVMPIRVLN